MKEETSKEEKISEIVEKHVKEFADNYFKRIIAGYDDEDGVINRKIHNTFISALRPEIQFYSALSRSLDSSLGNMLEKMAREIMKLSYKVERKVDGHIFKEQTDSIAEILELYSNLSNGRNLPSSDDYSDFVNRTGEEIPKSHVSDYYLYDEEADQHYLIELKTGGDLDNKKARSEKESLLEQYCILSNNLKESDNVSIFLATAYNFYGEGKPWKQERVRQYFSEDELKIGRDFWNFVCKSDNGYSVVLDAYRKNAHYIDEAIERIKEKFLGKELMQEKDIL